MSPTVHPWSAHVTNGPCKDNKKCIPDSWVCDKYADCYDESDEDEELCRSLCIESEIFVNGTYIVSQHLFQLMHNFKCCDMQSNTISIYGSPVGCRLTSHPLS